MRKLWTWSAIAALVVGVITWGAMFWAMIFHRKRAGDDDVAAAPDAVQPARRDRLHGRPDDHRGGAVRVHRAGAEQRDMTQDPNPDLQGRTSRRSSGTGSSPTRTRRTPTGAPVTTIGTSDTIPLLVLPTNRSIEFTQRSNDVIHSFCVPEFLFKRDVFPMPEKNDQEYIWRIEQIDREGAFVGRCAELCGAYHAVMNFEVRALQPGPVRPLPAAARRRSTPPRAPPTRRARRCRRSTAGSGAPRRPSPPTRSTPTAPRARRPSRRPAAEPGRKSR